MGYYCYAIRLPKGIREMVAPDAEGNYTIYLNDRLSDEQRLKAYRHAVSHCEHGDFEKADAGLIESEAHKRLDK